MSSHQHVPCLTPATRMSRRLLMVVALVAALGHAFKIIAYDKTYELPDERAAMHSPDLLQSAVAFQRVNCPIYGDVAAMHLQDKPWQTRGVFGLLVQFITERDLDVDDACQWVRTNLAESTTMQIQLLLSAADNLKIRLFIIAIGITLPLPTTRMPALPSVDDLRASSVIGPASTVLAVEVDHDENECIICRASNGQVMTFRYLWCGHRFHVDCIDRWLEGSNLCPMCRVEGITRQDAFQVTIAQREFEIPKHLAADVVRIWNEQA